MVRSKGLHTLLLCSLPIAVMSLTCYTCVFPAISPLDCVMVPQDCSSGQQCLYSTATATKGSLSVALHEKSCAVPSQCGLSGVKHAAGFNFSYTNKCCNIDLCNAAELSFATCWKVLVLTFGMVSFILLS